MRVKNQKTKFGKKPQAVKEILTSLIWLTAAGAINSVGVTMFLSPVKLYDSGVSGTAMLLNYLTPDVFTLSLFLIVLNVPLFVFGFRKQGARFTVLSVYTVAIYSLCSFLINEVFPVNVATSSPFAGNDLLLCAVFGGLVSGVGSGLTIRHGAAIDGVEVMAVIFAKRLGITVGTFVMSYNVVLYVTAGILLQSWSLPLYSIITYTVGLKTIDFIVEGLDKAKAVMIITNHPVHVCGALSEGFGSGITVYDAKGYYSGEDKKIVYFVVNRFQIAKAKKLVLDVDPTAFISITETSEVLGLNKRK
jgi:uncharacterized membrane-anchored protein YitT (DUF2179 family)